MSVFQSPIPNWRPRGLKASTALTPVTLNSDMPIAQPSKLVVPDKLRERYQTKKPGFVPSPQQADFFEWVANGSGSCVLEAVAGAGKTTTLIQALGLMSGSIFFGAYNKKISEEIRQKAAEAKVARPGLYISTMHAAGYAACKQAWPKCNVDDRKSGKILKALALEQPNLRLESYTAFICKMVSFGKQFLIGCADKPAIDDEAYWLHLMDHFSVDQDLPDDIDPRDILPHVMEVYRRSYAHCRIAIDFDDMVYAPLAYKLRMFKNDWVLVDECQDINPARRALASQLLKTGGRAIFVGDSRQAIYGFTGAGGDAIDLLVDQFNCVRLPLTVTYRCPKSVVEYAHQWVTHIQAHESALDGVVRTSIYNQPTDPKLPIDPWFIQDHPAETDAILCRYTRPLIQSAYKMIRAGIACKVEGRDIGNGLIAICHMWRITSIARLEERLEKYLAREIEKAKAADSERREQEITDKIETLRIFIERCKGLGKHTIDELVTEIKSMFDDNVSGLLTLSTIHRSKGREWTKVYWIQTAGRRPSKKEWEALQELNLNYVACTRAMSELVLVPEAQV